MESRPKRSSRNQNPSYTFKMETDFIVQDLAVAPVPKKRQRKSSMLMVDCDESQATSPKIVKLTEERKNDILELLKRDMSRQSTIAQVGNPEHIRNLAEKAGVPPKQLRKWLGITDDLTQITTAGSSTQLKEKKMVLLSLDYSEPSKNLTKLDGNGETFQEEKPLPEEEPLKPQQEILHATENAEQVEEKESLVDFGLYPVPINEDISPVQEETSRAHDSQLIDEERCELLEVEPLADMMETEMSSIWNQSDISAPDDDLGSSWVEDMWNTFMSSNNENGSDGEPQPASQSSEVFKDAIGDMEEVVQQRNEYKGDMESNEVPSSQFVQLASSSPSVCHQSAAPELEMSNLASVRKPESDLTVDVIKSTVGAIRSENSQEVEETVQPNKSTCSASAEPEKKKSKVLVTRKITDYFKKLDRGKKENKEE